MVIINRFVNELMSSNCFIVHQDNQQTCIIIDPGTEKCGQLIEHLEATNLQVDYVLLTHEHTDHTWGCNTIVERYGSKVVCSRNCKEALPFEGRLYFQLYYNQTDYQYAVKKVDLLIEDIDYSLNWKGLEIKFLLTPGHSEGSVCIYIDGNLFTGDTMMQYKAYISKKNGCLKKYQDSLNTIQNMFDPEKTQIQPGHGEPFLLKEFKFF